MIAVLAVAIATGCHGRDDAAAPGSAAGSDERAGSAGTAPKIAETTSPYDALAYAWDDRKVLCSAPIDDVQKADKTWVLLKELTRASLVHHVALMHAHDPGKTVNVETIDKLLGMADQLGVATVTYRDLVPGDHPVAGLALAFDDHDVDDWLKLRPVLAAHHAHVTFFVCCWSTLTADQRAGLATLAAEGHDIEPHGVAHRAAREYMKDHTLEQYLQDEVWPSFDVLVAAGLPKPTTFAYAGGIHDGAVDDAILARVARVRVTGSECPWK